MTDFTDVLLTLPLRWPVAAELLLAVVRSSVLVVGAFAISRALLDSHAAARRSMWAITLLALIAIGAVAVIQSLPASGANRWIAEGDSPVRSLAIALFWGIPGALLAVRLVRGRMAAARLLGASRPLSGDVWHDDAADASRSAGLHAVPVLRLTTDLAAPAVIGVRRPCILIPVGMVSAAPALRRAVLLHEIEHLSGRDVLVRQLGLIARALLWFSPATWMALRRARLDSERACDERALHGGISAAEYGRHLATLARAFGPMRAIAAVTAALGPSELVARLESLGTPARPTPTAPWQMILAIGATVALAVAVLAIHFPRPHVVFSAAPDSTAVSTWVETARPPARPR